MDTEPLKEPGVCQTLNPDVRPRRVGWRGFRVEILRQCRQPCPAPVFPLQYPAPVASGHVGARAGATAARGTEIVPKHLWLHLCHRGVSRLCFLFHF